MRKIENGERIVANAHTAGFKPFVAGGPENPGQSYLQLDKTFIEGAGFPYPDGCGDCGLNPSARAQSVSLPRL